MLKASNKKHDISKDMSDKAAMARMHARVEAMKLRLPPRPMKRLKGGEEIPLDPALPSDLTLLTDEKLGRLFSEFACMAQYVTFTLAMRSVEASAKKAREKFTRAKVRMEKTGTVVDKEAKVEVDPRTREAVFDHTVADGTEVLTRAVMEGYLIGRDACSREMTRRQMTRDDPNPRR